MDIDFTESELLDRDDGEFEENCELDRPVAHQAAANGEIETLTRAIRADPTILEHKDVDGLTPLIHAVMGEQIDSVKLLVKMGASINTCDSMGRTCLSMAAYQGWYLGVQLLLRNGAQPSMCDGCGRSSLHSATYCKDSRVLEAVLQSLTGEDVNIQDHEGMTPLHWAVFHNRPLHVRLLLSKFADPSIPDMDGKTVLHWGALNNCAECCEIFLRFCKTALDMINQQDFSGKTPIHFAAAAGHKDVIRKFADVDACDLEVEDPEERTPLHWAAATGQAEAVQTLLDLKVDASPVDVDGNTPLDYAKQSGHQECVGLLERQLGIQPTVAESRDVCSQSRPTATKNRRAGPLDFFVGLFRPKKSGKADPNSNLSSESPACCSRDSNQNNYFTLNVTLNGAAEACDADSGADDGTPKRHCNVLKDLEKLHISRGDNPALRKNNSPEYELSELASTTRPKDITSRRLGGKKCALPAPADDDKLVSNSYPDHSHLIRSPPPQLRREHSLSPVPSPSVMLRSETNRAQLEEDAAQILALHKGGGGKPDQSSSVSASGNALHPITARTGADLSPVSPRKPLIIPEPSTGPDVGPVSPRNQTVQLAPIKGPVPPKGVLLNKRLEHIKNERTGMNRSPTPPGWLNSSPLNSSTEPQTISTSPALPQRSKKKKKKKTSLLLAETEIINGDNDDYGDEILNKKTQSDLNRKTANAKKSSLPLATPRNETVASNKRKSDLDRSINSLLH